MWVSWEHRLALLLLVLLLGLRVCFGHRGDSGSCPFSSPETHNHHHCDHGHYGHYRHEHHMGMSKNKLPEELAEEEDLKSDLAPTMTKTIMTTSVFMITMIRNSRASVGRRQTAEVATIYLMLYILASVRLITWMKHLVD